MEVERALRIKTGTVKRLGKEFQMYVNEHNSFQTQIEGMRAKNAPLHDLKKVDQQFEETVGAMRETQKRLEAAFIELQSMVQGIDADGFNDEQLWQQANDLIANTEELIRSSS